MHASLLKSTYTVYSPPVTELQLEGEVGLTVTKLHCFLEKSANDIFETSVPGQCNIYLLK